MFEIKACKNFKPQHTKVSEDLKFLQQRGYRTLWTDTRYYVKSTDDIRKKFSAGDKHYGRAQH